MTKCDQPLCMAIDTPRTAAELRTHRHSDKAEGVVALPAKRVSLSGKRRIFRLLGLFFVFFGIACIETQTASAIIGGYTAPTLNGQVQFFKVDNGDFTFVCTGSLIAPDWVLTAAHCVAEGETTLNTAVLVGDLRLGAGETHTLLGIYSNPTYDAALLHLSTSTTHLDMVVPYGTGVPPEGTLLTAQGWGITHSSPGPPPAASVLQGSTQMVDQAAQGVLNLNSLFGTLTPGDSGSGTTFSGVVCGVVRSGNNRLGLGTATETNVIAGWIQATSGIAPAPHRPDGTSACEAPQKEKACDSLNAAGTRCVAAFSTVRALFGAYNGALYQVQRSDGAIVDIRTNTVTGFADAGTQDSFCANSTCRITKIYDQTDYHNDLSIEGPGGNGGQDSAAEASALPITVSGNKVYGVSVTPGVGYRNNNTIGVARNVDSSLKAPEGMYMVTSGTNVNGLCCFDFGNAETNSHDNGNGHMDALNFGTYCGFPPCTGSGPWVEADLENGQYMGGGSNPSNAANVPLPYNFVTAMLKNDSQTSFALRGGNAQSGSAVRLYSGSLPTQKPGYVPMQLEGGIVLGTGGDNSAGGIGSFFEGAMTSGYPTDAAEDAVQEDIVAAHYAGDSSPTHGEAPKYTGPSDPHGPGPQDDFAGPAIEQPTDLMGSKPAMAYFRNKIYVAFQADDASHKLFVTSTINGTPYPTATGYPDIHIGSAPAMAEFRHRLYIGFQADDGSHVLFTTSSADGGSFPTATGHPNIEIGGAPAMTTFDSNLYVSFQANDGSHTLFVTHSQDGTTWPTATPVPNVQIGSAPAMAAFHNDLYVAFRANDSSNDVWIAQSPDGVHFTSKRIAGPTNPQTMGGDSSPALVVSNGVIYCIYGADDLANEMLVMASTDGVNWQGPKAYLNVEMGSTGPGASVTNSGITVGFQSNDSRNVLFTTYKQTETASYTGPNDPNGSGPQDYFASPAIGQPKDVLGSKPAFAAFNGRFYTAFQANDSSNFLYVSSTTLNSNFPTAQGYGNISIGSAPAMAEFNGKLYIAFQANDGSHALFTTSSWSGTDFPTATGHPNIRIGGAPALAVFNDKLYAAFQANDGSHVLFVTSSSDGTDWPTATGITNVRIGSDPSLAVYGDKLYVAFRADDSSNDVWIASSSDGVHFYSERIPGQQMGWNSSPALASYFGYLFCIYRANDAANEMLVTTSQDGTSWDGPKVYSNLKMSDAGPSAVVLNGLGTRPDYRMVVGFQAFDASNVLFVTSDTQGNGSN